MLLACLPACLASCPSSLDIPHPTVRPTARLQLYPCEPRVCVSPRGASVGGNYTRAFRPCTCVRVHPCARVLVGGPGPTRRSRPVPSRSVEYRTAPLATRYPQQFQPARPPDCLPVSHRTPNRLHSEAIREPFSASLPATLLVRSLVGTPLRSRHPRLYRPSSPSPTPSFFLSLYTHTYTDSYTRVASSLSLLKFSPSSSLTRGVSSRPTLSRRDLSSPSSGSRVTLGERTSTGYRSLCRLLFHSVHPLVSPSFTLGLFSSDSVCPFFSHVLSLALLRTVLRSPLRSARDTAVLVSSRQPTIFLLRLRLLSLSLSFILSLARE